jgi:CRP-like cAMP-binding protein
MDELNREAESAPLIKFFNELQPLAPAVIELCAAHTYKVKIKKNALLVCPDSVCTECLFFILKGAVRGFILDEDKDITVWLTDENNLIGNFRNPGVPKMNYKEHMQALEDTELLVMPYDLIDQLYAKFPETNIIGRKLLAIHYHVSQERSILSRIPSAEARYKQFKETHPLLHFRVPVKFLASYLGMRIETLSRLRKKSKQENDLIG